MKQIPPDIFSYYNHEMDNSVFLDPLWDSNPIAAFALRGVTPIGIGLPDEYFMKEDCLGLLCEVEGEDFPKWFHIMTFMVQSFFPEEIPDWCQKLIDECKERSEEMNPFKHVHFGGY